MKCPACPQVLTEREVSGLHVDVCEGGCGGIWFDNFELSKVDEAHEATGETLLDIPRDPGLTVDHQRRRRCPRCAPAPIMMRHFMSVRRQVEIDTCPACNGVWLDAGELARIRGGPSPDDREREAHAALVADFGGQMATMRAQSTEHAQRAQSISRALRFLAPSTWFRNT